LDKKGFCKDFLTKQTPFGQESLTIQFSDIFSSNFQLLRALKSEIGIATIVA